jgi:hypothetical protein
MHARMPQVLALAVVIGLGGVACGSEQAGTTVPASEISAPQESVPAATLATRGPLADRVIMTTRHLFW